MLVKPIPLIIFLVNSHKTYSEKPFFAIKNLTLPTEDGITVYLFLNHPCNH